MKKFVLLLIIALSVKLVFPVDAAYFKNSTGIDFLYVDSPEGLRIRDTPSLSGNRIGVLFDRMKVKVISVGKETRIDGIQSNWVKILLPVETVKSGANVYGWVFGGYLTDRLAAFSTKNWTDRDLQRYLCRFSWVTGGREFHQFDLDGSYRMGLLESGAGGNGTYSVSMADKTITVQASYGDEEYEGAMQTDVFKIVKIEEDKLTLRGKNYDFVLLPSFTNSYFYGFLTRTNFKCSSFEEPSFNALMYSFTSDMVHAIQSENFIKNSMKNLIKMGVFIEGDDEYKTMYSSYWN